MSKVRDAKCLASQALNGNQVDWPHVLDEIERSHAQQPEQQDEIARLTARLIAAEALVTQLRSRLDDLSNRPGATKAELATAPSSCGDATARPQRRSSAD